MDTNTRESIIFEAKERLENLKDYSARRREWYQDARIRIADRQSQHISLISSISAAILALTIVFPFPPNIWIELSFWSLVITVILGTLLVLFLIFFDKKVVDGDGKIELSTIDKLKKSTEKVIKFPERYDKHIKDFKKEVKKIEQLPDKYDREKKLLNYLYLVVLASFVGGILSLIGAWITKCN